ncbi:hypothetical protein KQX54_012003 [Cotesia glomerata]|uniref:DNA polymerase zeta catalytic subunit n=1 Tax=Cotesia glomerata TaxID=32391 RepID=A0AAV7IUP1_COTGL|nr:hypothetical protein KQX54_012003 [Cotesia glomerata]
MFSVRLVNADSYQATPLPQLDPTFSEFRGTEIKHVPIVRVFGTTHTGEKTCLHLHGVFPYLYVPFTGDDNADGLAYRLAASLDAAINISLGSANSNTQHVYQVQRVAGIPFYGYHRREHQFFKVSFYNPAIMKKAIDLLQNGSVLNQSFQPHEAHIPFILQFMMDYNLHGMSMINLSSVKYRRRITQSHSEFKSSNGASSNSSSSGGVATTGGIITPVDELDYLPACVERQSICELEVDGLVSDILNRQDLERGIELNPGLAAIWEEERARRAQAGLACEDSQLVNPKSPGRPPYCLTDNDLYQQQRFNRRLYMVSQCNESTLSSASSPSSSYSPASLNQSSYPIETLNDDQLMNASNLPSLNSQNLNLTQHINEISSLNSNKLSQESKTSQLTNETSILDSEDIPLIEILMDLARDSEKHGPVDNDSILGTQTSAFDHEEIKSDNEDDDVIDFNLTCLDIDSMSPWGSNPDKSPPSSINTTETTNINRPIIGADTTDAGSLNSEESQLPQLDGAGDLLSFLESEEDENIIKYEHQVKRIPEYQAPISTADYANRVRVFNTNLPCNDDEAFIMEEGTSSSNCSPMSQQDAWSFYLPTDADNIDEFVNMNFELLGSEFDSDYETTLGLNSLLEGDEDESSIGINLIVDNGNNECVPLEAVLNGDPCFTQTAEMDKSDLTELKDQYDSLLGSELVPIAYKNFRESDSCVDNNNTRLDSNDKCGQVYSNSQSQQLNNDNTSKEAASTTGTTAITPPTNDTRNLSSENVTPNIQEPDGKVNTLKSKYDNSKEFSSSRELATAADSSDYNCNLVARWEELQDLKFIPKRVLKKKGFVRPRKQILRRTTLSESMMARKRGYFRRGPANLANQVFTSDNNNTTTVSPVPDNDNLPNNLIYNVTQDVNSKNDNTTICNNNNRQIRATDRTGTTDKIKLFIENSRNVKNSDNTSTTTASSTCNSNSTSKTRLSADTRATLASTTTTKTSSFGSGIKEKSTKSPCSLDDYSPSASSNFSPSDLIGHVNTSTEVETSRGYCNGEMDNLSSVVGNPDEVDNNPTDGEKTKIVDNKHQSRYLSYYSSVNAHSGVPYGQNKHRHCLYSSYRSAFVKDYVFTVDQVWVIDKRKRGTAPAISASVCTKDCCRLPIVLLDKLNIVINKSKPKSKPKHTQANRDASSVVIDHVDNVNYTCDTTATATTTTAIKQQEQNQEQQKNDGPVIIKRVFEEMSQDGTASKKKRSIILKLGNRSHSTVSIKDENKSNLDESFNENFVQPRGMKSKRRRLKKIKRLNEKVIANGINKESKIHSEKSTPHLFRSSKSSKTWSSIIDKPRLRSRVNNNVKSNNSNNQLMNNELTDACSVANGQLNLITSSQSEPIQSRKRPEIWCSISRKNIDLGFLTAKSLSSPVYKGDNVPVIRQKPIVIRHIETLPKTYKIKIYSAASNVKSVCESEVDTTSPEDSLITFQNDNSNNNNTGNVVIDNNSVVTNNNDKNVISNTSQVQQFSEFDTTLDVHLCDSIYKDEDDVAAVANEIFDTAAGGIVEEERISLVDCTANSSQESEQYTKAIAEANFYAGKNYTIDAISLEIPQCLFEEDSNSESLQKKSLEMITESSMPEISVGILSPSHVPSSHSPETPAELDKLLDNNLINGLNDLNYSISSLTSITDKTVVKSQPLNEFVQPGDSFNSITSHKFNPRDHTSTECNYVSSSSSSSSSSAFEFSTSAMLNNLPSEQLNFEDYFDVEQIIQMINSALILNDINLDDNTLNNQLLSLSKEDNICGDNNKVDDEKTKTKYSPNKISIIRKIYKTKGDNNKAEKSNNGNTGTTNQADENLLLNPKQGIDLVDIEAEAPDNSVIIKPNNKIDLEFNEPMKIDADGDDDNSVNGNDKDVGGEDEKLIKFTSTDSINTKAYENNWNNQESRNEISSDCAISQNTNLEKFVENVSSEIFNQNDNNEQQSVKTITTVDDNENKVNVDTEVIKLMDNILSLVSIEKSMNNMYNNDNVDNIIDTEPVLNSIVNNNLIDDKGCEAAGRRSNYLSQSNEISTTVTAVENNTDCNKVEAITDKFCSDNKNIIESLGADGSDDHEETEAKLTNEKTDVKLVEPEIEDKITTGTAGSYCEVLLEVNEKVKSSVEQSTFESSLTITDNQCSNEQEIKLRFKEDYTEVVFNSDKENIDSHECSIHSNSIPEVEKDPEEAVRAGENKEEEEINGDGEEVQEDKLNIDTGSKSGVEQENTYTDDSNGKNISKESVFRCRELSVRLVRIKLNEFNQYLNSSNGCGNKSKIDANSSLVEFESGKEAANASSVKQKFGNSSGVKKCVRFDDQVFIFETNTRVPLINFDEKSEEEEEAEKQRENFTEGDEGEGAVEPECQGEGEGKTERVGASEVEGEGGCDEEEPEVLEEEEEEEAEPEPEPEIAEQEKMVGVENQELDKEKEQQVEKVKDGEKQDNKKTIDKDEISVGSMKKCEITDSYKSIGNKNDSETKFNGDVIASSCINKKHDDEIIVISDSDEYSSSDNDVEFVSEEKLVPDSCVSKKLNTKIIDKNFVFTENSNGNTDKLSHVNVNGVIRNKNETSNDKKNKKYSKSTFKDINPIKDVPRIRSSSFGTVTVTLTPVTSTSTSTSIFSDSCGNATTTEAASLPNKKSGKRVKELATKFTCVSGQNSSKSTKTEFNRDIKEQQQFSLDNIQEMESKLDKNLKDVTVLDESTIPVDKNIKEKSRLAGELLTKFTEKEPPRSRESTCKRKRNNNNNLPRQSYLNSNNNIKANSNSIIVPSTVDPTPTTSSLLPGSMVESRQSSDDNRLVRTYRMLTSYRTKIHTLSIDQRMVFTRVAVSDQEFGSKQVKEKFLEGIGLYPLKPQGCGWKPAHITTGFMQLQQPRVILQRLTPSVLKYYGYTRRFKSQRFGKRFKTDVNNRFTIPAYDGPADLSSTDSESDTDITLDCREKRVCDYKPRKHFQRCEATVTPRKRKNINSDEETGGDKVNLGEEDLFQGARDRATQRLFNRPTAKHSMPLTDNKIYYQSPTRATTSKSSGLSGNYTPLKIIITSPKVRKLEHTSCDQPTIDNHNRTYSHSRAEDCLDNENSCVTPRRRRRLLSSAVTSTKRRVSGDSCQTLTANDERQQTD